MDWNTEDLWNDMVGHFFFFSSFIPGDGLSYEFEKAVLMHFNHMYLMHIFSESIERSQK